MSNASRNDDLISYWTEWSEFGPDDTLSIKVTGLDGDAVWTGFVEFHPAEDDYGFWYWVVIDAKRRQGVKRTRELELLRAAFNETLR